MTDNADVIIVGAGVQGAALALHLLDAGVSRVRVLERDEPFQGTSAAGAGFVAIWAAMSARPYTADEVAVERYGLDFYRQLRDEGHDIDFAASGLLLLASTEAAAEELAKIHRPEHDPGTVFVERDRIHEVSAGTVAGEEVHAAVFQPAAAQVFTPKLGQALVRRVLDRGGTVTPRCLVHELIVEDGAVRGVRTSAGEVRGDAVVLAAGAWTNELLRPLGTRLPFVPHVTSRVITEPVGVPADMPAMMLFGEEPRLWIRQHERGLLWGGVHMAPPRQSLVELERLPGRLDELPLDSVLECERVARRAARILPALGRFRSMTVKHGAPCFTPDRRALVGPVPGVSGLYALAGDNEAGVTHGPGFARLLADRIVSGTSALADVDAWRIDRFGPEYGDAAAVEAALAAR